MAEEYEILSLLIGSETRGLWVPKVHEKKSVQARLVKDSLADRCICVTPIAAEIDLVSYALNYAKLSQQRPGNAEIWTYFVC